MKNNKIGVIGMWHLGCVYSASLAKLGYKVTCFDYDSKTIENLQNGVPPLFEPGLEDTLQEYKKNITFTSSEEEVVTAQNYIFITFDLPVDDMEHVEVVG